ncbi:MAG: hypothetical protein MI919_25665 [Holophagales bacterium]|nr:hypothetical protein [Holophagales bacterium]
MNPCSDLDTLDLRLAPRCLRGRSGRSTQPRLVASCSRMSQADEMVAAAGETP